MFMAVWYPAARQPIRRNEIPPEARRWHPGHAARMIGINATTGGAMAGIDHLRQSIRDILTTRVGERVMRRAYGSRLPELVDAPLNGETIVDLYAETFAALNTWEPRIVLEQISASFPAPGRVVLSLVGVYTPTGEPVTVDGIEVI